MQSFRILVNEKDTLVVRAPDQNKLQEYIDTPGEKGNKLLEIVMAIYETEHMEVVELGNINEEDTIISWKVYQNELFNNNF